MTKTVVFRPRKGLPNLALWTMDQHPPTFQQELQQHLTKFSRHRHHTLLKTTTDLQKIKHVLQHMGIVFYLNKTKSLFFTGYNDSTQEWLGQENIPYSSFTRTESSPEVPSSSSDYQFYYLEQQQITEGSTSIVWTTNNIIIVCLLIILMLTVVLFIFRARALEDRYKLFS